nr:MAG TPA: hypothetical protein [Caudoviricetes sp.]
MKKARNRNYLAFLGAVMLRGFNFQYNLLSVVER